MATTKKIDSKKTAKKNAKPMPKAAPKKAVKPVIAKKAPAAKPKPVVAPKKNVKPAPKAEQKKVAPPKAAPAKKVAPVSKKTVPAKTPVAKPVVKKEAKKVVAPAKKVQPVNTVAPKAEVKKETTKLSKTIKTEPVAIKKTEKKKELPLKEVKIPKTSVKTSKPYSPDYKPLEERNASSSENSPITRYSDGELEEFRELINKKLADATREVTYLQGIITRKDDMGGDVEGRYMTMEDGTVSMEREQMSQMVSRQISFIDNLKKALIRIENKTYGVCRVTGKLIDKARLRAVPHATLSLEAKMGLAHSKEQNNQ